ncbi:MAG: hypothetical protein CR988_06440 [Treponema sp.]|nr:MAG: hypothetical protein CR988_06440 [Treponema sp.]
MNLSKLKASIRKGNLALINMDKELLKLGATSFFVELLCVSCSQGCVANGTNSLKTGSCITGCEKGCSSSVCSACTIGNSQV